MDERGGGREARNLALFQWDGRLRTSEARIVPLAGWLAGW